MKLSYIKLLHILQNPLLPQIKPNESIKPQTTIQQEIYQTLYNLYSKRQCRPQAAEEQLAVEAEVQEPIQEHPPPPPIETRYVCVCIYIYMCVCMQPSIRSNYRCINTHMYIYMYMKVYANVYIHCVVFTREGVKGGRVAINSEVLYLYNVILI